MVCRLGVDNSVVGELTFDVGLCSGHRPGHVTFHYKPSELALVGGVIFQGSIGRADFSKGSRAN